MALNQMQVQEMENPPERKCNQFAILDISIPVLKMEMTLGFRTNAYQEANKLLHQVRPTNLLRHKRK